MHRKLFAFVFVAALLSSAVVVFADSDDSDATSVTTITGYIGMAGIPNTPAVGMVINLNNVAESLTTPCVATTDANGFFTLDLSTTPALQSESVFHIYFSDVDYIAQNLLPNITRIDGTQHLQLDLSGVTGTAYQLGNDLDHGLLLVPGHGDLEFTVKGSDRFLKNAMITLKDEDSAQEFSGETASNGKYTFPDLPYGVYNLKVTCNGYKTYTESVLYNGQATHNVTMVEKEIPTFYGMTTYHALMFLGVAVGLILVMISHILVKRNWKGMKD